MKHSVGGGWILLAFITASALVPRGWGDPAPAPQPALITAHTVPTQYYLSLPHGWTPKTSWPILVTIDGSGHNFLQNCQGFAQARGDRPFIIVTPCVTSNGNDPADQQAVLAIVREVQAEDKGQPRFFLTGFSAGGHVTWQIIFAHPDLLAAAAPAAANFIGRGIGAISENAARVHLPIQAFQGDSDPHLVPLNRQWDAASQLARAHGYQNLSHAIVPGAGHAPLSEPVMAFFSTLLPKTLSPR